MRGLDDRFFGLLFYPLKFFQNKTETLGKARIEIIWNKNSDKAILILPQWMGEVYYYRRLINDLSKSYTIAIYKIPNQIISHNADRTIKYFEKAKKEIFELTNMLNRNGCMDFSVVGVSITSCLALIVANKDKRYKKIVLGSIGADFAECFWDSKNRVVHNIRKNFVLKGINLKSLKEKWRKIAPRNNLQNLEGRDLLILLSKNDQLVKFEHGLEFLALIKNRGIVHKVDIDPIYGHYLFILRHLLISRQITEFIGK